MHQSFALTVHRPESRQARGRERKAAANEMYGADKSVMKHLNQSNLPLSKPLFPPSLLLPNFNLYSYLCTVP